MNIRARLDMKSSPCYYKEDKLRVYEDDHLVDRVKDNRNAKLVETLN